VQRHVVYLGEINDGQQAAWSQSIEVLDPAGSGARQLALFNADRPAPELDCEVVPVRLSELSLHRPRQWGGCWLLLALWDRLALDGFWAPPQGHALAERAEGPGVPAPVGAGQRMALADWLVEEGAVARKDTLYRCLDRLLPHQPSFFNFLAGRWQSLFDARFDVLRYDLTSTSFEGDVPDAGQRTFGKA